MEEDVEDIEESKELRLAVHLIPQKTVFHPMTYQEWKVCLKHLKIQLNMYL